MYTVYILVIVSKLINTLIFEGVVYHIELSGFKAKFELLQKNLELQIIQTRLHLNF